MVLIQFLSWYFIESPKAILRGLANLLYFNLNYFSIPILLKTLFSHWHRYRLSYGRGFSPSRYAEVFIFNMFSRIIGAIVRIIFIIIGVFFEIFLLGGGIFVFLVWFFLPLIIVYSFIQGIFLILS